MEGRPRVQGVPLLSPCSGLISVLGEGSGYPVVDGGRYGIVENVER